jgi:ribosomal protein L15E
MPIYYSGQAKRVRKFFEDLMKQNQPMIDHDNNLRQFTNKVQRNNKRGLRSDVFQKLIEHFDTQ